MAKSSPRFSVTATSGNLPARSVGPLAPLCAPVSAPATAPPLRTTTSAPNCGAPLSGKMMVARSVVNSPRKVNWPCSNCARKGPETLICRSARTCTCSCSSSACSSMAISGPAAACAEAAADCTGASLQRSTPLARSWPPLTGASVRLPLRPKMRAALPRPPARRNSSIVNWLPCSVARSRPSCKSTPSSTERKAKPSAARLPCQRGWARLPDSTICACSVPLMRQPGGARADHTATSGNCASSCAARGASATHWAACH